MENKKSKQTVPKTGPKTELKKLSDVKYVGDKKTFTESLTKEQIVDLLDGYNETDFSNIKMGFHVRYFKENNGKMDFRMGGTIIKIEKDYVIVSNGKANWSVQKNNTTFYQQAPLSQIKKDIEEKYIKKITENEDKIQELMALVRSLNKKIKTLEKK